MDSDVVPGYELLGWYRECLGAKVDMTDLLDYRQEESESRLFVAHIFAKVEYKADGGRVNCGDECSRGAEGGYWCCSGKREGRGGGA